MAFLNMSDPNQVCPSKWTTIASPLRGKTSRRGCNSVFYSTYGMTYTHVCGRIIAYQHGIPDTFNSGYSINETYIDGVSLTHGSDGSRQHIWSFISAGGETISSGYIYACSSSNPWPYSTPFIGDDYFCDSGNHASTRSSTMVTLSGTARGVVPPAPAVSSTTLHDFVRPSPSPSLMTWRSGSVKLLMMKICLFSSWNFMSSKI